jgi:hypothetical protein
MGAGVCVALLVLSLLGGREPSGGAVAAVRAAPALSMPVEAPPAPATTTTAAAPAPSEISRPAPAKRSERGKRAHRSHARGKRH